MLHDLAHGIARQGIAADLPVSGHLEVGQGFGNPGCQFIGVERAIGCGNDDGLYLLAQFFVIHAHDGRFRHSGVGLEAVLDLGRIHVFRASYDEVPGPRVDHQFALFAAAYVSRAEPSSRQDGLARLLGKPPVFQHDPGAAHEDLPVDAFLHRPARSIPYFYLDRGKDSARRMGFVSELIAEVQARQGGTLSGAIPEGKTVTGARKDLAQAILQIPGHGGATGTDGGDLREVILRHIGMGDKAVGHRTHGSPVRDPFILDDLHGLDGIEATLHPNRSDARGQRDNRPGVEA